MAVAIGWLPPCVSSGKRESFMLNASNLPACECAERFLHLDSSDTRRIWMYNHSPCSPTQVTTCHLSRSRSPSEGSCKAGNLAASEECGTPSAAGCCFGTTGTADKPCDLLRALLHVAEPTTQMHVESHALKENRLCSRQLVCRAFCFAIRLQGGLLRV